jgi:hypothetical protein
LGLQTFTMPKRNRYQMLVSAKARLCDGKTTKTEVRKKATAYVKHATNKGSTPAERKKAKAEAQRNANRVLNSGCAVSTHIGKKKRKGGKRKSRVRGGLKVHHVLMDGRKRKGRRKKARRRR